MVQTVILAVVLVAVALTVGTVVAAVVGERWAQTRGLPLARQQLADLLATDAVTVAVPERPLLPALLRGPGTVAQVWARDVPVGDDARLRELEAHVPDVRVRLRTRELTTGPGRFTAVVAESELGRLVQLPGVVSRLELRAEGLRVWTVLAVSLETDVLVTDAGLRVLPDPVQLGRLLELPGLGAFRRAIQGAGLLLPLPELPLDARVEDLVFGDGEVTVTGTVPAQRLPLRDADGQGRQRRR